MIEKIIPSGDRLIVEVFETEVQTVSGIVLPDSSKDKKYEGRIISIGELQSSNLQPGVVVYFSKFSGDDLEVEKKLYKILKEDEVMAYRNDGK